MDIQVGDRITYRYINSSDKKELIRVLTDELEIKTYIANTNKEKTEGFAIEILKIERPSYEVVEEKKELLTYEEREFLKSVIEISNYEIGIIKRLPNQIIFKNCNETISTVCTSKFQALKIR